MTDAQFKEASWDWVQSPVGTTLTIPLTNFGAQSVSVAVSQAVSGAAGTLHTALTGATTTVVVTTTSGTFGTGVSEVITINGHAAEPVPTAVDESATTKWGDIGDWDVSSVKDLTLAFSKHRNVVGGSQVNNGNPKAAEMNSDLSKWNVAKITTLAQTFYGASKFVGTGLDSWDTTSVTSLYLSFKDTNAFTGVGIDKWNVGKVVGANDKTTFETALALNDCRKLEIVTAWALNAAFISTNPTILTVYAAASCPVRSDHQADERFSPTHPTHHTPVCLRAFPPLSSI